MSSYLGDKLISGAEQFVGESRNIGQIIPSTIPLTDAGLHLLDGALIQGDGIYSAFVDYIAGLYGEPETFTQPTLTSNGTLGGKNYAVWTDVTQYPESWAGAWGLFNDNGLFHSAQYSTTGNIIFYSPKPLNLTNITFWNQIVAGMDVSGRASSAGNIYGSNDGTNWTLITTYTNSVQEQTSWSVNLPSNTTYYKYYKINSTANGGSDYWCIQGLTLTGTYYNCPDYFCTEEEWQQSVLNYGVCGKFVYDSTNNTVRLPKYNSKIYTGGGTAPVIGNGLPMHFRTENGSSQSVITSYRDLGGSGLTAAWYDTSTSSIIGTKAVRLGLSTNPENSGLIAQLSNITTSLDGYYYIVIATSTKTDIEVDIDEVVTDLNGKADVDLTNVANTAGFRKLVEVYNNGASWYKVFREYNPQNGNYIGLWCEQGGQIVGTTSGTLTYLKPYKDMNYTIYMHGVGTYSGSVAGIGLFNPQTRTISSCTYYQDSNITTIMWQACGYIN